MSSMYGSKIHQEITDIIKKDKTIKKETIEQVAKDAGLIALYNSAYKLNSGSVHSSPSALQNYLENDKDGNLKSFYYGPEEKEIGLCIKTAIALLTDSTSLIAKLFELEKSEIVGHIETCKKALGEEYQFLQIE